VYAQDSQVHVVDLESMAQHALKEKEIEKFKQELLTMNVMEQLADPDTPKGKFP
jgi:hypothetical protein